MPERTISGNKLESAFLTVALTYVSKSMKNRVINNQDVE